MTKPAAILRVAILHVALLAALLLFLALAGKPVRGAVMGGGLMGLSMLLLVAMARAALAARQLFVATLASCKIFLYLALVTAALTGKLVADGAGFAAGVTCFVLAVVGAALLGTTAGETT